MVHVKDQQVGAVSEAVLLDHVDVVPGHIEVLQLGVELHVADVVDVVVGEVQHGDAGVEIMGDVVEVGVGAVDDVLLMTVAELVTGGSQISCSNVHQC